MSQIKLSRFLPEPFIGSLDPQAFLQYPETASYYSYRFKNYFVHDLFTYERSIIEEASIRRLFVVKDHVMMLQVELWLFAGNVFTLIGKKGPLIRFRECRQ